MKKDRTCQYCGVTFKNIEGRKFSNHVYWCEYNSNRDDEERSKKISEGMSHITQKRRDDYYQNPNYCANCGDVIPFEKKRRKFCDKEECKKQARSAPVSQDNTKETKWVKCAECGKEIEVNKRASPKYTKCNDCKIQIEYKSEDGRKKVKKRRICKVCGQEKPCPRPDVCKKYRLFPKLAEHFGFDLSKKGTIDIYKEFDRVKNLLVEDYWDNEESLITLAKKYNHSHNVGNFSKILTSLEIDTRDFSNSQKTSIKNNRKQISINYDYITGWHTTWNNKDVFYRSSYELDYAQKLDEQQIDYEMEDLRILYWDSQKQIQRVAIPDFYLPEMDTIVEIKSTWTYDEQNMKDKFKEYTRHGYNFKLVLEGKEYIW